MGHISRERGRVKPQLSENLPKINKLLINRLTPSTWYSDRRQSFASCQGKQPSILQKLLPAAFADQMFYMGGLIGEGLTEYRIGQAAGAKGLPEGLARVFGHHILAVIPWHQYHDMAGALPAFVTATDFSWWVLIVLTTHKGAREEREVSIIFLSTWISISPCQRSEQPHILRCCRLAQQVQADARFCGLLVSGDDMAGGASSGCPASSG